MKRGSIALLLVCSFLIASGISAKQKGAPAPQTSLKTISEVQGRADSTRDNLESWVPTPSCESEYFEVLPANFPDSRCHDIMDLPPHGRKIVHYYTCRFKNEYPPPDVCSGAKMSRVGLESYTCESDEPIDAARSSKPCIKNYKLISEWHGDIDKDLAKVRPYGFICKADVVPAICLAPKYEYVYRSGTDHCCVLYK